MKAKKRIQIETRGPKVGQCDICGVNGPLTEDHTPPKGCYRPRQVEIRSLIKKLSDTPYGPISRISQNGVKYRTLCGSCNNTFLGGRYDPAFISFVNEVSKYLTSRLELPSSISILGQPQKIARSVLGHIAAQGVDRYRKGLDTDNFKNFFLDTSLPLPENLTIYYWAYPYHSHVMTRDTACVSLLNNNQFSFWLLKFFPLAFMITWDKLSTPFEFQSFNRWRDVPFETGADIPIILSPSTAEHWPEAPTEESIVAFGPEAVDVKKLN